MAAVCAAGPLPMMTTLSTMARQSTIKPRMRDTAIGQLESSHRRHDDRLEILVAAAEQLASGHGGPMDIEELEDHVTWFARTVPMHFGDEDEVVFPALVAARADLAAPLAAFTEEHPG